MALTKKQAAILDLCDRTDSQVCQDLRQWPQRLPEKLEPVYYVGGCPDSSAGLPGYALTPSFFSLRQLEKYVRSQIGKAEIENRIAECFAETELDGRSCTGQSEGPIHHAHYGQK
jgi:hypothetical protein